jgi:hypothetical protein
MCARRALCCHCCNRRDAGCAYGMCSVYTAVCASHMMVAKSKRVRMDFARPGCGVRHTRHCNTPLARSASRVQDVSSQACAPYKYV